ncbi:MAG TPA: hypothetical protein VLC12_10050 [Terriglobales bacterium]|nr:hypothetical protein [Terriglobales bacterium]
MIRQQVRAPKIGDRVGATGQKGAFEIIAITNSPVSMAKLRSVSNPAFVIDVPFGALKFLRDEEPSGKQGE